MTSFPEVKPAPDKLSFTVLEAGRAIGVSRSTVFDMIRTGELRGRTLTPRSELQRVLEEAPDARRIQHINY